MICECKFIRVGLPMDNSKCPVHPQFLYHCDRCDCEDYRPHHEPTRNDGNWPKCLCGHIAQDHN